MKTRLAASKSPARILRSEDSLRSRLCRGICMRLLYECDAVEIVRTEMEPGAELDDADITKRRGLHFVIDGSPVFHVAGHSSDLMPGDSIALDKGQHCTVSNPASSSSSILSLLFKSSGPC